MKHDFLDHHSLGDSFFHRLHPGAKMVMVVVLILCTVSIQPGEEVFLIPYALALGLFLVLTKVPILHSLSKGIKLLPFVLILTVFFPFFKEGSPLWSMELAGIPIACTQEGVALFWNIVCKSTLAIFFVVFLNLTTPFHTLLKGMQSFGAPRIMTDTLAIAYRYLFVIEDERERMLMARRSRMIHPSRALEWRSLSQLIGMLFVRSYNRGERLYQAMCARGFTGTIVTLHHQPLLPKDIVAVSLISICALAMRISAMWF
jgi:cobalt/nickel transport system permease protein